jgi:Phage integrase, N-terminal SAM-like domain
MGSIDPPPLAPAPPAPRLLDQVRARIRVKHYSIRTEEAYVDWIRRFVLHFGKRHPRELGAHHVEAFLSDLAITRRVADSMQNQAKAAHSCFGYSSVAG